LKTLIIAEAGVNHNGDIGLALRLVDTAAEVGADIVKFQTFRAERLTIPSAAKADYQAQASSGTESQQSMLRRLELTRADHDSLIEHCRSRGIQFLSTAFDHESFEMLSELGLERFKVPSGELTNLPYLRLIGARGLPVIVSSGMATLDELGAALAVLEGAGTPRRQITVLHCTTEYPTPMADVNLRAMLTIRDTFGVDVGYSDHTSGIEIAVAAVAMGASVIEKHLTIDRCLPGPDHRASLEPAEFASMVGAIRNLERAMGDGIKRPCAGEARNAAVVRKSIVAVRPIREGEPFSEANLTVKRPGTGVSPMQWDDVIGKPAPRDFAPDELIEI
jgi:N,N'-diacetyllegionaminate synthase